MLIARPLRRRSAGRHPGGFNRLVSYDRPERLGAGDADGKHVGGGDSGGQAACCACGRSAMTGAPGGPHFSRISLRTARSKRSGLDGASGIRLVTLSPRQCSRMVYRCKGRRHGEARGFAVFRLMTSSKRVGCSIGRSAGFALSRGCRRGAGQRDRHRASAPRKVHAVYCA